MERVSTMSYKVTKANESVPYEAKGHFDVRTTRLHNPEEVNEGMSVLGLSHFLPGGGASMAPANFELIYYIVEGEMTVEMDDGQKFCLQKGDSIHMGKGTGRSSLNTGVTSAQMLVIMIKP